MYEIIIENPAESFIKSLKKSEQKKLLGAIEKLAENPRLGKQLVGRLAGLRSLHVTRYRVIYKIEEVKLVVLVLRASFR